jgi:hypothetical protein
MPEQTAPVPAGPHPESRMHCLYRDVLELFLLLFLVLAGTEFLLEKAEPVVVRWNTLVKTYNDSRVPLKVADPAPPPAAGTCLASGGTQ